MSLIYHRITDLVSWFKYAPPKEGEKQWKCKRSAMELARYVTRDANELPEEMKEAIGLTGESCEQSFTWEAEYVTPLVGTGEGRNHDMAIWGEDIFIGVEAKADERFDKTVASWIKAGTSKNSEQNRTNRINDLCKIAFGKKYDDNKSEYGKLRYQLLSAFGGTIREAVRSGKKKALLLILVFESDETSERALKNNNDDFISFTKALDFDDESNDMCFARKKDISGIKTIINDEECEINVEAYIEKKTIKIDPKCGACSWYNCCKSDKKRKK